MKSAHLKAWDISILSRDEFDKMGDQNLLSSKQMRYLAQFGVLAPTSHNTVPQRFKLFPETSKLVIVLDRNFVLPESDKVGRQAIISLGCVAASLRLSASKYGYDVETRVLSGLGAEILHSENEEARYLDSIELTFTKSGVGMDDSNEWLELMLQRKVLRAEYDQSVRLTPELKADLLSLKDYFSETGIHIVDDAHVLRLFGKFQENADRFVMENRKFAQELGDWLLPNTDERLPYAMRGREFGLDDVFAQQIHDGLKGKGKLLPDQIAYFSKGGKVGIDSSSAVVVISVNRDTAQQRILAGEAYMQAALILMKHGYYTAVHAGITEVDWVNTMFASTVLRTTQRPSVVFRVGKPKRVIDEKRPHSYRPAVDDLIISP